MERDRLDREAATSARLQELQVTRPSSSFSLSSLDLSDTNVYEP